MKETDTQLAVCQYLQLKQNKGELMFWRANNMPVYDTVHKRMRAMPKFSRNGVPDIIVILNCEKIGIMVGLEVKTDKGKLSESQILFQEDMEKVGSFYFVVRSIEDCQKSIDYVREKLHTMWKENKS